MMALGSSTCGDARSARPPTFALVERLRLGQWQKCFRNFERCIVAVGQSQSHAEIEPCSRQDAGEGLDRWRAPPGLVGGDGCLAGLCAAGELGLGQSGLAASHADQVPGICFAGHDPSKSVQVWGGPEAC